MSKATIVSIYPRRIHRNSIGIIPPAVLIEPCTDEDNPVFYHVEDVHYFQYILDGRSARIPIIAFDYAKSVVKDFHRASFGSSPSKGIYPGVAAVDGIIKNLVELEKVSPGLLKKLKQHQLRWKESLVKKADSDWSKIKNPALISDIQIQIARDLKLNKEWAKEFSSEIYIDCPACYGRINSKASICMHCKTPVKAA
jgi:hypothetical protein